MFLRNLGLSDNYIIKIFALVGDAAAALTEDDPYWLLDEFPAMKFETADKAARILGIEEDSYFRIRAAIRHGLALHVSNGHTYVPCAEFFRQIGGFLEMGSERIKDVAEDMTMEGDLQIAVIGGREVLYFYGYYRTECRVVAKMAEMAATDPPPVGFNMEAVISKAEMQTGIKLSGQQRKAVTKTLDQSLAIITGGPGTGKTTLINVIIRVMEDAGLNVAVAAPTGRAAKRISEAGVKSAVTIHRLLEYYYDEGIKSMTFGRNSDNPLDYDVVIIDEASMIDLMLMGRLCAALKPDSRLILTGDADQLPSVGAGNVLRDLIESGYICTSELNEIFRQESQSRIISNAHRINKGMYPQYGKDFIIVHADKQQEILDKIASLAADYQPDQLQVITPTRKGLLGSVKLNEMLRQVFNPPCENKPQLTAGRRIYRVGDRVMQIKNNYRLEYRQKNGEVGRGVFNGEMGTVASVITEDKKIVVEYDDDRWVEYPYVGLDEIEPAFAITVHKSQGSEFPVIIIPMSWFPPALAMRNLIYTAVTRGRQQVIIVGREDYFNAMVDNIGAGNRNSGLKERLIDIYEGI